MSVLRFADIKTLKEIQAKIFLQTNLSLTQQEILELSVGVIAENIDLLVDRVLAGTRVFSDDEIKQILAKATHWGKGTENLSESIDETVYV